MRKDSRFKRFADTMKIRKFTGKVTTMNIYDFTSYEQVMVCGDIHGHFEVIYGNIHAENTLFIVAGDCGFGFNRPHFYEQLYASKMGRNLNKKNNAVIFIRGNHDDPVYFDGLSFNKKRAVCIPDYSIVRTAHHNILCIGGAISIDRTHRKQDKNAGFLYWPGEAPVFNPKMIKEISASKLKIDTVISHSGPSFCPPHTKDGIQSWLSQDPALDSDLENERKTMDAVWHELKKLGHPVRQWWYGHFHRSAWQKQDNCYFRLLDINEMDTLKNE